MIDGLCEKAGVQYDQYAAQLTLSEYTKLKTATAKTVKQESREGIDQQKVSSSPLPPFMSYISYHVSLVNKFPNELLGKDFLESSQTFKRMERQPKFKGVGLCLSCKWKNV